MSRSEKLAFALAGGTKRNVVLTDEVKQQIDVMVDGGKKANEIFKALKDSVPGIKYQNVRSYIERQLNKALKTETPAVTTEA